MARLSMLERVKEMAVAPEPKTIEQLDAEIHSLRSAQDSLFDVELTSSDRLRDAAFRLGHDKKFHNKDYKRLSIEPLSWTTGLRNPRPVFAVYNINDPVMTISNETPYMHDPHDAAYVVRPRSFPSPLARQYARVAMSFGSKRKKRISISSTFTGVIPAEVRPKIKEAIELFEIQLTSGSTVSHVYLMAEASNWQLTETRIPQLPRLGLLDPLVVGWDGLDLWLITSFDLTPLEDYIIKEFPALEPPSYLALPSGK